MFQVLPSVGYYHAGSILQVPGQDWQVCDTLLLFDCPIPDLSPPPKTSIGLQRLRNLRSVKNFEIIQNKDREIWNPCHLSDHISIDVWGRDVSYDIQVIYPLTYVVTETSLMVPHTSKYFTMFSFQETLVFPLESTLTFRYPLNVVTFTQTSVTGA